MGMLLALLFGAIASLGAMAALRRPRLGRFVVTTDDERSFSFVTDTGRFRVEFEKRELTLRAASGTRSIPLDQIERLDFAHAAELALLEELLQSGPSGWLRFPAYVDRMHWLTLWLVLAGGERVQLYAIGQLEPREPWLTSLFALETALLARLGLFRDVEHTARQTLEKIQAGFARSGRELGLS
jgi:hypothetical protein